MNNIEELYELINPELLTDADTLHNMMRKAFENKNRLDDYIKKCIDKLAQIYKCKVITNKSYYNASFIDYYLVKSLEDLEVGADCQFSEEDEFGDGDYDTEYNVIVDYTEKK